MSAGVNPMSMPCRAATNPAAQNTAAPTPQVMPMAMERGGFGLVRSGVIARCPIRLPSHQGQHDGGAHPSRDGAFGSGHGMLKLGSNLKGVNRGQEQSHH